MAVLSVASGKAATQDLKLWLRVNGVQPVGLRAAADSASTFARPVAAGVPGIFGRLRAAAARPRHDEPPQTAFGDPTSKNKNSLQRRRGRVYAPHGVWSRLWSFTFEFVGRASRPRDGAQAGFARWLSVGVF